MLFITTMAKTVEHIFIFILCFMNIDVKVGSLNIVPDVYMQSGILGHCGETVIPEDSIFVKSHFGFGFMNYGINEDCRIHFRTLNGNQLLVKFVKFELEEAVNGVCNDYVIVSDTFCVNGTLQNSINASVACNNTFWENRTEVNTTELQQNQTNISKLCGTKTGEFVVSKTNITTIVFVTNGAIETHGFNLLVTSFHEEPCTDGEFRCDTTRCISKTLTCDGVKHCLDQSDENKTKAGCSIIGIFGVLGETGILAIVIIASASILTIFVSIMVWQIVRHRKIDVQTLKSDDESHIHAKNQPNEDSSETAESQIRENTSKGQYVERAEDHRMKVPHRDHAVEISNRKSQANEQDLNKTDYHNGEGQVTDQVFDRAEDHKKEDQINDQALDTAKNKRKKLPKDQAFERSEYKNRKGPPKDQAVERAEYSSIRGPPKGQAAERGEYDSKVDPSKDQPFERAEYHLKESPPKDQTYVRAEAKTKKQGVVNADYYRNAQYETKNRATVSKLSTPVTERPPKVEKATKGTTKNQKRSSMPPVEETNKKSRP